MEVPVAAPSNLVVKQASFKQEGSVSGSTDFSLRTQEGDLVSVALGGQSSFSESGQETQFDDGTVVSEFSSSSQAASRFSLNVQGELNEEELAAIDILVGKVSPIAQSFFSSPEDFDLEGATSALAGSLGVVQEIELKLERTVSVSTEVATRAVIPNQEDLPEETSAENANPAASGIRDIASLVQAVVDSVFQSEGAAYPGEDSILQSLNDLKQLLNNILQKAFDPLNNPEVEEFPEETDLTVPPEEDSHADASATRFEPITV